MADLDRQFPIEFPHTPPFIEDDFLPSASNRLALEFLAKPEDWPHGRLVLWGGRGSGKTHLLHNWARAQGAAIRHAGGLREPEWPGGPLGLDDIDQAPSEKALLHLLNAAAEAGRKLLMTAAGPPARLPFALPDLASRLRATTAVELGAADEDLLATLLERLLADRQMRVAPSVRSWLLRRLPRTPAALREAVARLDRAALAAGAKVSRALAAHALADLFHDNSLPERPQSSPPDPQFGYKTP